MNPRVLLINPWIYDFAAANVWSRPLGLLKVAEYLSAFDLDLKFIDCLDSYRSRRFNLGKYPKTIIPRPYILSDIRRQYGRYGISIDEFVQELKREDSYDAILVTSVMTYWYPGVKETVRICKEVFPYIPVIIGGIYATLNAEHAMKESGADFVYQGKINESIDYMFDTIDIRLNRVRDPYPWYRLGLYNSFDYAPILTAEGCPYRCSYCASGRLNEGFKQRDVLDVVREIHDLYSLGTGDIAFYDDALFYRANKHIKQILKGAIDERISVRYHTPNGFHARYVDHELSLLMKRAGFATVRLSLETINSNRLRSTGGKVTTGEFYEAVLRLKRAGFSKKELGAYLMYGLPGQCMEEVWESVRFIMDLDIKVHLSEFSPIPGTMAWDQLATEGKLSRDTDPLLTNNSVYSLLNADYNGEDIQRLKDVIMRHNTI